MPSGDWATWVGSIGIVLTLAATVWQLGREARLRRREQIRAQAVAVAAWYIGTEWESGEPDGDPPVTRFAIFNGSAQPIYEVVVTLVFIQGAAPRSGEDWLALKNDGPQLPYGQVFGAIGPGQWSMSVDAGWGVSMARPGCEIGFSDAASRHWIRRANGELESIDENAIDHYGIQRPIDYAVPDGQGAA